MSAESATLAGRAMAESLMVSECVIDSGEFTGGGWNEETLSYDPQVAIAAYEGKCRWKAAGTSPREVDAAGQILIVQTPVIHLPVLGAAAVEPGQMGRITANPLDPSLVGTEFRITGDHSQSFATSRRFPVEVT